VANRIAPVEVFGRRTDWRAVSAGSGAHACATRTNGRLFCWGYNSQGQLGSGTAQLNRYQPIQVSP
jgi:alpha-tubulin suppressor-like RCC1 family protein